MFREYKLPGSKESILGFCWEAEEAKKVMCVVHGIGEHALRYGRMAERLNQFGITVLAIDLRGHGCSAGKRGHTAPRKEVLSDVDFLLEYAGTLYPELPIILYGHSMGGNIALDYRVRGKLSHLPEGYVISAPWLTLVRRVPRPVIGLAKVMSKIKPDFQISADIKPENLGNPAVLSTDPSPALLHNSITVETASDGFEIGQALLSGKLAGNGGGTEKPLLLMHGGGDKICSVESTRAFAGTLGENCTYIEWPGLFHEIHNGNKENDGSEVIETIARWVTELSSSR